MGRRGNLVSLPPKQLLCLPWTSRFLFSTFQCSRWLTKEIPKASVHAQAPMQLRTQQRNQRGSRWSPVDCTDSRSLVTLEPLFARAPGSCSGVQRWHELPFHRQACVAAPGLVGSATCVSGEADSRRNPRRKHCACGLTGSGDGAHHRSPGRAECCARNWVMRQDLAGHHQEAAALEAQQCSLPFWSCGWMGSSRHPPAEQGDKLAGR